MILSATLRLKDNFTSVMQKANQATKKQAEAMKTAQTMTGEMQKSISALNAQMRVHKSELKENITRLNASKNSLEALKIKQEAYTKQLNTQKQIVSQLTTKYKKLAEAHGENSTKAMRAAASLAKAKAEQAKLERQIEETTNAIKNQSTALGRLKNDFEKAKADAMPTNRFEAMRGAGTAITGAGMAGAVGLGATIKTAADFESAMSRVAALSGATDRELQKLTETARKLGATTSFSASQAAEGMQFLSMAGFKTNEIIAAMPGMLDMAAAAQIDLGRAADISSNILSAFGLQANEMGRVADVLTKAFTSANVDLEMLGYTMKYVGPIANATGLSLEEMTAAAGLLGNAGIQADQAGTTLRATILRLADPPKEAAKALETLGVTVTDADGKMKPLADILEQVQTGMKGMTDAQKTAIAASIAGTEAASGFLALLDAGPETLRQFTSELQNSGGTAEEIANRQLDNLNGSLTMLKSATEGAAISIGSVLSPYVRQAAEFVNGLVDKFNNLSPSMQKTIAITAAIATGFALVGGPLLLLIGMLPAIAAGFSMLLGPVGLVIAAIGLLVAAGIALWMNWDTIKSKATEIWEGIKQTIAGFIDGAIQKFNEFKEKVTKIWNDVKSFLKNPIKGTVNLIQKAIGGDSDNAKSHAIGLPYVPYDNYPALLHKGETVLTRAEADQYRKGNNTNNSNVFNININGYNRSTDEILDELEDRLLRVAANMGGA